MDTEPLDELSRDIADVAAVEVITTVAVHLLSAAAVSVASPTIQKRRLTWPKPENSSRLLPA